MNKKEMTENMRYRTFIPIFLLSIVAVLHSCSEWTSTESVRVETVLPWEQNPADWQEYMAAIRDYKGRNHYLTYVRFENSPESVPNERGFMRCLPDSLDIVSLTNAGNFSGYDAEDMEWMHSMGTRVLYQLDFAGRPEMLYDGTQLATALDRAISTVKDNGLDGFSFTGLPRDDGGVTATLSSSIIGRLSDVAGADGLLVFEGNPAFIGAEDIAKIDYFVLATENLENSYDLRTSVQDARDMGIDNDRILLAADLSGTFKDIDNAEQNVLEAMSDHVVSEGPLAGLALYGIEDDYYHYDGNWLTVRSAISRLNP